MSVRVYDCVQLCMHWTGTAANIMDRQRPGPE